MLTATHPEISDASPIRAEAGADINLLVRRVFAQLPQGAPFYQPKHIAVVFGLTDCGVTWHCRQCKALRLWRGSYKFFVDDPGHMAALESLVKLMLWSGRKLPATLRVH